MIPTYYESFRRLTLKLENQKITGAKNICKTKTGFYKLLKTAKSLNCLKLL